MRVGIYADDLTGALDAAAPFAAVGMSVYVSVFGVVPSKITDGYRVLSLNIDTRHGDRFPVFDKAARASKELRAAGFELLVNKIDSTLRGHAGLEARAGLLPDSSDPSEVDSKGTWSGPRLALIAPSFPVMNRQVVDGIVMVNGDDLMDSEVGRDPSSLIESNSISELVSRNTGMDPVFLKLSDVRMQNVLGDRIRELLLNPPALVVCDAKTDSDLDLLAAMVVSAGGDIILCGSAGATNALAKLLAVSARVSKPDKKTCAGPCLVVSGSQSSVSEQQINLAAKTGALEWLEIDVHALLDESTAPDVRDRVVTRLSEILLAGYYAAVSLSQSEDNDVDVANIRTSLVRELGAISYRVSRRVIPGSLVLIGGDTSQSVLRAIGATGIVLHSELLPGVPLGVLEGGLLNTVPLVTKAGAFGREDTISQVIGHMT